MLLTENNERKSGNYCLLFFHFFPSYVSITIFLRIFLNEFLGGLFEIKCWNYIFVRCVVVCVCVCVCPCVLAECDLTVQLKNFTKLCFLAPLYCSSTWFTINIQNRFILSTWQKFNLEHSPMTMTINYNDNLLQKKIKPVRWCNYRS
jgi:hypothetical protein